MDFRSTGIVLSILTWNIYAEFDVKQSLTFDDIRGVLPSSKHSGGRYLKWQQKQ